MNSKTGILPTKCEQSVTPVLLVKCMSYQSVLTSVFLNKQLIYLCILTSHTAHLPFFIQISNSLTDHC